jgi:putative copper resistance protein D
VLAHLVLGPPPPAFSWKALLTLWVFDPYALAAILAGGALYWWGVARLRGGSPVWPWSRIFAFYGGLLVCVLALLSPIDTYSDVSFAVHMVQHLLLVLAAAPLFALGAPVTLLLRAARPETRKRFVLPVLQSRPVSVLTRPVVAWVLFAVVQYATHFTGFYNLAAEHLWVHAFEHLLYLGTAVLFWWPVVGLDPSPHKLSHPARLLYLVLAMPLTAFLGVAIISASAPLYPHYAHLPAPWGGAAALNDQNNAGAFMWEIGGLASLIAVLVVAGAWFRHDEARQRRIEAEMDRAAGLQPAEPTGRSG